MVLNRSNLYLYAAYTSTCLEDRAWSFCVSLCMSLLGGMRMVSIEQLMEGLLQMAASGPLGKMFDQCKRKTAIQLAVPLNNLSIVLAAGLFIGCLSVPDSSSWFPVLLISGMVVCSVNRMFLNAEKFIVGRDWVVVLGKKNLADLNAILTSLDQLANVISPLLVGGLVSLFGLRTTCMVFGGASLFSMASKVYFLSSLYRREPLLHTKEQKKEEKKDTDDDKEAEEDDGTIVAPSSPCCVPTVMVIYYRQTVFTAALGMAFLFMTVLGFDGLAVGYGQSIGLPESLLGGFRSFGSAMGIAGAICYAISERRMGVRKTGLLGLVCQNVFLIVAVVSIWLPGSPEDLKGYFGGLTFQVWWDELKSSFNGNATSVVESKIDWHNFTADGNKMYSIFAFLIGIASARFGLWMADLSITHLMQVNVPATQRNTVFGVHNALCQSFSVLKDLLVIALPDPSTFAICILVSYAFVCTGFALYVYYLVKYPDTKPRETISQLGEEKESLKSIPLSSKDELVERISIIDLRL